MIETCQAVIELRLLRAVGITFLSGLMLGYTGWGGALVSMPLLVFFFGPIEALAILNIGVLVLTAHLFPSAARKTDWPIMAPMLIATVICAPIGSWFLFFLDPELIRRIIGLIIISSSVLILLGWRYRGPQGFAPAAATGAIAGLINGFIGLGGPPMVIYLMAIDKSAEVQRACILVGMAVVSVVIFITLAIAGVFTFETAVRGFATTPLQWAGGIMGAWLFAQAPAGIFKKFSLLALVCLGVSMAIFQTKSNETADGSQTAVIC